MAVIAIPEMGTDLFRKYMSGKFQKNVELAGGRVKWIPLEDPAKAVKQTLECDGLLMPGGPDIDPTLYHQTMSDACGKTNPLRDGCEPAILKAFLATGKPILAVCRGMQLLNIGLGGTLYQDIKEQQRCKHSDFLGRKHGVHPVTITRDSILYNIVQTEQLLVNSIHHQAVNQVGDNLLVTATSPDGFVEGIQLTDHPFCIGVQWHPEHMSPRDAKQQKIFTAFLDAVNHTA